MNRNDIVTNKDRDIRYRVERLHRDGSVTVRALFALDDAGQDRPGYLGYKYRVDADSVLPLAA